MVLYPVQLHIIVYVHLITIVAVICFTETSQSVSEGEVVEYTITSSVPSSNDLTFTIHPVDVTATGQLIWITKTSISVLL